FVSVRLCRINCPVSDGNRIQHTALTFFVRYLINAIAQLRHFYTIIQSHILHNKTSFLRLSIFLSTVVTVQPTERFPNIPFPAVPRHHSGTAATEHFHPAASLPGRK